MRILLLGATATCLCAAAAFAEPQGLGVGVMIGEPTGVSVKKWLDASRAIDGAAAWSLSGRDALSLHADYLFHKSGVVTNTPPEVLLHFGVGGRIHIRGEDDGNGNDDDDVTMGVRLPIGFTYLFRNNPVEFFMELAPVVELIPDTDADMDAAIGIRFYFR
ncbi:MAG: hypothetical protein V1929_02520 [bacterium]